MYASTPTQLLSKPPVFPVVVLLPPEGPVVSQLGLAATLEVLLGGGGVAVVEAGRRVRGREGGRGSGEGGGGEGGGGGRRSREDGGGEGPDGHVALLPPIVGPQPGSLLLQLPDPAQKF